MKNLIERIKERIRRKEDECAELKVDSLLLEIQLDDLKKQVLENLDDMRDDLLEQIEEKPDDQRLRERARLIIEIEKENNLHYPHLWHGVADE